jgi:hypothetical protein
MCVKFTIGQQPCNNFKGKVEHHAYGSWVNEHQCYRCRDDTTVSWCENCNRDHHENGYETCKAVILFRKFERISD